MKPVEYFETFKDRGERPASEKLGHPPKTSKKRAGVPAEMRPKLCGRVELDEPGRAGESNRGEAQ